MNGVMPEQEETDRSAVGPFLLELNQAGCASAVRMPGPSPAPALPSFLFPFFRAYFFITRTGHPIPFR